MNDVQIAFIKQVLPHLTSKRLSRLTNKSLRVVQKWFSGDLRMPLDAIGTISEQNRRINEIHFREDLDVLIKAAQRQDVHPEVIASFLAHHYLEVTGSEIE